MSALTPTRPRTLHVLPRTGRPVTGDPRRLDAATRRRREEWPVALVVMPFHATRWPSIQAGLLTAIAVSHGFPAETHHLNLDLAAAMDPELYDALTQHDRLRHAGDWIFAPRAFGADTPDRGDRFTTERRDQIPLTDTQLADLTRWRNGGVDRYLDQLVERTDWDRYRVVAFTTTFAQTVPSLALAAALKHRNPELVVVFGGANCEGPMGLELARTMNPIDYVATGEGDVAFTDLLVDLSEGRDPAGRPGLACRRGSEVVQGPPAPPLEGLDDLPTPEYGEYFARAAELGIWPEHLRHQSLLPAQSARGCWWGEKRHCTFCGLNGSTMAYRSMSPARLRRELATLSERHGSVHFFFVDNILDRRYIDEFLPQLRADGVDYSFFYEVKADLTREELKVLAQSGIWRIQPGIESLSSHVLGLMRKGVRAADNVNVLRWARHYGIDVTWNLIYGFPHETRDDYREQADLIPNLVHLQPPHGYGRIWMERFSPIFTDREAFPVRWISPDGALPYIYPAGVDLDQLAYFFEAELEHTLPEDAYDVTRKAVEVWREAAGPRSLPGHVAQPAPAPAPSPAAEPAPSLTVSRADTFIQVLDRRVPETVGVHTFEGPLAALYLALMDKP
jgi:ribosomal peptide maturation radical SAM protein 1